MKQFYLSLMVAVGLTATLWAADDPFCGKWKLNMAKSKFTGEQIQIQDLGNNKYKWTVGDVSDTIAYDGSDQPVHFGQTISMLPEGKNAWRMVIKKDGRVLSTMIHALSDDGKTQTIKGTDTKPDGSTSDFDVVWKKMSDGSGWSGTWEEKDVKFTSPDEWDIEVYEGDGLSFRTPAYLETLRMKFDGKEYEHLGPNVAAGSTSSGKRVNSHTLDVTNKVNGQVMDHTSFELSPDGKMLTLTIHEQGQKTPVIIVYDKI